MSQSDHSIGRPDPGSEQSPGTRGARAQIKGTQPREGCTRRVAGGATVRSRLSTGHPSDSRNRGPRRPPACAFVCVGSPVPSTVPAPEIQMHPDERSRMWQSRRSTARSGKRRHHLMQDAHLEGGRIYTVRLGEAVSHHLPVPEVVQPLQLAPGVHLRRIRAREPVPARRLGDAAGPRRQASSTTPQG